MNKQLMEFKIDTGADVTVIALSRNTITTLRGPSFTPLTVTGKFCGELRKGDRVSYKDIFVVKNLQSSLLGRPASESLNLLMQIEPITANNPPMTKDAVMQQFPSLFGKLGKLNGLY